MPRLKLLLFDANIVIHLHEINLWEVVVNDCDVHLSKIVVEDEVKYYHDDEDIETPIDLSGDVETGRIHVFEVSLRDILDFRQRFDPSYFERLDPGEAESLAFMVNSRAEYLISSADSIVFKVLGNLNMSEQGISLEEVLQRIGRGRSDLDRQYTKNFRERYTREGQQDSIMDRGDLGF